MILGKGDFGPEKYNESYLSFIENQHRKQGLDVIQSAHEKFSKWYGTLLRSDA